MAACGGDKRHYAPELWSVGVGLKNVQNFNLICLGLGDRKRFTKTGGGI